MSHVQIVLTPDGRGSSLLIDGVDVSSAVLADSVRVELSTKPGKPSIVHLALLARRVELDLPDTIVKAHDERAEHVAGTLDAVRALLEHIELKQQPAPARRLCDVEDPA